MPRNLSGRVLGTSPDEVSHRFAECCRAAGVAGLHFHDLRHEATSRLFEAGLSLPEVASITGHRTWAMLRRYTHPRAEDLARRLAQVRPSG